MSENNISKIIREEYIKCATDPIHFLKKYCYIQHPDRGRILFHLYPFQEKVLNLLINNDYSLINKSRQLGISTLVAGLALHMMIFQKDKNILCIATKQDTAKNLITKVKFMYSNLPTWLKLKSTEENNKLTLRLSNGSQIKATSAASDAGRSEAVSLLIIDEAAFISNIEEIWGSAQQTLATGGNAIVLSTPFGTGNWFHKNWVLAEQADVTKSKFIPIRLPWYVHPERDQKWRDDQDTILGDPRTAAQECDCDFATSGDTVFYGEIIEWYQQTYQKDPIEKRGLEKNLWIWENVDYSRAYMVIVDVARGDGKDYSTFHVMDIDSNTQVAEYKGQIGTRELAYLAIGIATEYNEALLIIENTGIGWDVVQTCIERGYVNLYYSPKSDKTTAEDYFDKYEDISKMVPGFSMNLKTRPMIINKFREYFNEKSVVIQSKRTYEEMKVFVWKNGRAEAQSGYNDDLIMPMGIGLYIRDTAYKFKQQGLDLTREALKNFQTVRPTLPGAYNVNQVQNPYKRTINGYEEDFSWVL